jgi:Type II CAAX prenyl endopeptidase Rce1-like
VETVHYRRGFVCSQRREDVDVRAYLMTELVGPTGSSALAIAVSVLVQTLYHLYYGWFGAACLAFPFLVFALYCTRYRRALPVIVAHEVWDLISLIRICQKNRDLARVGFLIHTKKRAALRAAPTVRHRVCDDSIADSRRASFPAWLVSWLWLLLRLPRSTAGLHR